MHYYYMILYIHIIIMKNNLKILNKKSGKSGLATKTCAASKSTIGLYLFTYWCNIQSFESLVYKHLLCCFGVKLVMLNS